MPRLRSQLVSVLGIERQQRPPAVSAYDVARGDLFWVTRDMAMVAYDASEDMPAWTPAAVAPSPTGMLIWATDLPPLPMHMLGSRDLAPVTGVAWSVTPSGGFRAMALGWTADLPRAIDWTRAGVPGGSALTPVAELVRPDVDGLIDPVTAQGVGAGLVMMLGATWILMDTATVAEPRTITGTGSGVARELRDLRDVRIVDLRRLAEKPAEPDREHPGREYTHRWYVRGHWRQQAVGPKRGQRRPTWIPGHIKGPPGAPLIEREVVMVWRR